MPQPAGFYDPGAELALLAALQAAPALVWSAAGQLTPAMFTEGRGETFAALVAAAQAEQPMPDLVDFPPSDAPEIAATRIRQLAVARILDQQLEHLGRQLNRAQAHPPAVDAALAAFEAAAGAARQLGTPDASALVPAADLLAGVVADARERVERRERTGSSIMGLPTGFPRLDELLNGLEPGLLVLAGRPGMGKTTLANLIAGHVAGQGTPVLYVTYENSRENLVLKHLCRLAGIPEVKVRRGLADPVALAVVAQRFGERAGCLYYMEASADTTVESIRAQGLQIRRRHGSDQVLVIVDYLQKMAHAAGYDELRASVGATSAQLRDLARVLGSPVLALASLNRAGYGEAEKVPTMAHLKESGDIEYGADVVLLLSDGKADGPPLGDGKPVTLRIAKNRGGESGTDVSLVFRPSVGDFREQTPASIVGMNGARR